MEIYPFNVDITRSNAVSVLLCSVYGEGSLLLHTPFIGRGSQCNFTTIYIVQHGFISGMVYSSTYCNVP